MKSLFILFGITIAFGAVSLIVWLTRGKKRRWVERKLRLGGLLVSITAIGTSTSCGDFEPTCHARTLTPFDYLLASSVPQSERITFTGEAKGVLTVSLAGGGTFDGTVSNRKSNLFSYVITDGFGTVIQSGDLAALDGSFNSATENFSIVLGGAVVSGSYTLNLYGVAAVDVVAGTTVAIRSLTLDVVP